MLLKLSSFALSLSKDEKDFCKRLIRNKLKWKAGSDKSEPAFHCYKYLIFSSHYNCRNFIICDAISRFFANALFMFENKIDLTKC